MHYHTTKKLRFGCGASLNSRLPRTGDFSQEKTKRDTTDQPKKNSQQAVKTFSAGHKQE